MSIVSYAQNFEDVLLWRALHDVENGSYLDIGAQDPVVDSVSLAFYQAGWRGVHVEACPAYVELLRKARPDEIVIEAAVTDALGLVSFFAIDGTGISTGVPEIAARHRSQGYQGATIQVPPVRLDHLLESMDGEVHWLKIDVEGMEPEVLRSWGDSQRRPWLLVIESTVPLTQTPTGTPWIDGVRQRGYSEVYFDGLNRFFVHEAHDGLRERFSAPANVFDEFDVARHHFSASLLRSEEETREQHARADEAKRHRDDIARAQGDLQALKAALNKANLAYETSHADQRAAALELARVEGQLRQALQRVEQAEKGLAMTRKQLALSQQSNVDAEARADRIKLDLQRQFADAEAALRRESGEIANELRIAVRDADRRSASLSAELVRFQERAAQLETRLVRAEEESILSAERLNSVLDDASNERAQARADREQARTVAEQALAEAGRQIVHHRSVAAQADALIREAVALRLGRWQKIGEAVGLLRPPQAWQALTNWRLPTADLSAPPMTTHPAQESELVMYSSAASNARNPYLRADSLAELLSWYDVDFVRCAYVTMLGRQPDPEGEAYYTERVRSGYSKLAILGQLRRSAEGANHDPGIAGLDRVLRSYRNATLPIVGPLVRFFTRREGDGPIERRLRSIENLMNVSTGAAPTVGVDLELRSEVHQIGHKLGWVADHVYLAFEETLLRLGHPNGKDFNRPGTEKSPPRVVADVSPFRPRIEIEKRALTRLTTSEKAMLARLTIQSGN